jgi:hypothetical protein
MTEAWRELKPGDVVTVVRALSTVEAGLLQQQVRIKRFSQPHGYAVVEDREQREWHLHPEALEKVDAPRN